MFQYINQITIIIQARSIKFNTITLFVEQDNNNKQV